MHPLEPASGTAATPSQQLPATPTRSAWFALAVLFSMNLLNYMDRYVLAAVGPAVMGDLGLGHRKFGYLAGAFMVVYTIVSPLMGWMGDRYDRRRLLAFGVGLWSLATVGTAFAQDFRHMFVWRALLGVGEASYGVVAPPLLADLFPVRLRGRVIGIFYLALPIGAALGYGLGGGLEARLGWRWAFAVVGLPGLVLAGLGLTILDPGRGASEGHDPENRARRPGWSDYLKLFTIPSYLLNMLGMAAVTFTIGAYGHWGPTFYNEVRGMGLKTANYWLGGLTALAGLVGIALGTWASDRLRQLTRTAYLFWAFLAVMLALPFGTLSILDTHRSSSLVLLFLAMVAMASVLGPCNTVPANVIPPNRRAAAYAMNIMLIHLLGDISSPILIGTLSDAFGRPEFRASRAGRLLDLIGALPTDGKNLTAALLAVAPVLALGAIAFLIGSRFLARDEDRARDGLAHLAPTTPGAIAR